MSILGVTAPAPVSIPEASPPKAPDASAATDDASAPQPTVLAALPPGQGTRIDQIA